MQKIMAKDSLNQPGNLEGRGCFVRRRFWLLLTEDADEETSQVQSRQEPDFPHGWKAEPWKPELLSFSDANCPDLVKIACLGQKFWVGHEIPLV